MKTQTRLITAAVIGTLLIPPATTEGAHSRPLDEDAAPALLRRTLKRDQVYEKRMSLDCIAYGTEETTNAYFEFVLREIHNTKCGGDDPDLSPAIDQASDWLRRIQQLSSGQAIHKIELMKITKNIGMLLLAVYLIVDGLLGFGLNLGPAIFLLYFLAITAGILILLGK